MELRCLFDRISSTLSLSQHYFTSTYAGLIFSPQTVTLLEFSSNQFVFQLHTAEGRQSEASV